MFARALKCSFVVCLVAMLAAVDAEACRIIEPVPVPPRPEQTVQPIQTRVHAVDIQVKDQVAEVHVNATFYNPNPFRLEGTYWFPLPAQAAVKNFEMSVNGQMMKGELLDAQRARQIYEDIVRRMRDPGLLEWMGSQMLKCRVFPMEPNAETKIALSYTYVLEEDAGMVRLTYPLRSAKPDEGAIGQLVVKVSIESTVPLKTVYAPSQAFDVHRENDHKAVLTYEAGNVEPARNIDVLFSRDTGDVGLSVVGYNPEKEDGTFLLLITPKIAIDPAHVVAKDILFVFDTSGSMRTDNKIEQAKKALEFCVRSLNPGDRFNIIAFSGDVRPFKNAPVDRTDETVEEAVAYIDKLQAVGGTALNEALLAVLQQTEDAQNVPLILFLTDGNPTIGEQNIDVILKNAAAANKSKARLFVFGVGYDVNTQLLDLLAEQNHGDREYVAPKEDIEIKVSALYSKVANPVLSDVHIDFGDAAVSQMYPKVLPDLFHGGQLSVLGRFSKPGEYTLRLTGRVGDEKKEFTYTVTFPDSRTDDYLPRLWGLRKVAFLLDEIRLHGEKPELVDEITRLGKLHGIITPYTSFLVVEEGAAPPELRRRIEEAAQAAQHDFASEHEGRGAVDKSSQLGEAKRAEPSIAPNEAGRSMGYGSGGGYDGDDDGKVREDVEQAIRETVHHVAGRTFYAKTDGTWVDSRYDEEADEANLEDVELWSDAFYKLVDAHPEIGTVAAETQKFIVVIDDDVYRIQ